MSVGVILVAFGVIAAIVGRVGRRRFGDVADGAFPWWHWATGILVAGGLILWPVGDKSVVGRVVTLVTAAGGLVCFSRWAYLMDVAGAGRHVVMVDATLEWPLKVIEGNTQRPLELSELRLRGELPARLHAWASVPPVQRDQQWTTRGEMLLEQLAWEVGDGRWEIDQGSVRAS